MSDKIKRQIEVLKETVETKWKPLLRGSEKVENCACCKIWYHDDCEGCPIEEDSGSSCHGTPFHDGCDEEIAPEMLDYLNNLVKKLEAKLDKL